MITSPYGSWPSPVTAKSIASGSIVLGGAAASAGSLWWSEQRPSEGGRTVVVRDGEDVTPPEWNVRTQVHEYGGGAWWVWGESLFFSNWADQRLHRQDPGGEPVAISPTPEVPRGLRYAAGITTADGRWIVCVRERHFAEGEAANEIVILPSDGSAEPRVLAGGNDFYSFPRLSPDGSKLCWTEWSHPNMPWDGTTLFVADFSPEGLSGVTEVAGGIDESIFQPQWSPDGALHFVSDRSGWWNLYRCVDGNPESVAAMEAEFGSPQWVFDQSRYAFLEDGSIVCSYESAGIFHLALVREGRVTDVDVPYTWVPDVRSDGRRALCVVASGAEPQSLVAIEVSGDGVAQVETVKRSRDDTIDLGFVSMAEPISFESEGRTAHAFYYAPKNAGADPPPQEKPPLLVLSHGGPTGRVDPSLKLALQFWTSRGFAVVDVNYGGSTGYGRTYRRLLNGNWGVVDLEDCVNAARYLAERGDVDADRMAIRGGSAGGYTTLCALVFSDVFKAGANYFGVAELETFVGDTHKFESRYLDSLVGPYPERKDLYFERSPTNFVDQINCPVITFQGLEDAIVPPSQSEAIVDALRAKGIPCAYVTYEGEQHGFRKAENIVHSLESELYFYGKVFGFEPADELEPVAIENL